MSAAANLKRLAKPRQQKKILNIHFFIETVSEDVET